MAACIAAGRLGNIEAMENTDFKAWYERWNEVAWGDYRIWIPLSGCLDVIYLVFVRFQVAFIDLIASQKPTYLVAFSQYCVLHWPEHRVGIVLFGIQQELQTSPQYLS